MRYSADDVLADCQLTPLQLRAIFIDVLHWDEVPNGTRAMDPAACLVLWAAMLLERLAFLTAEQRGFLLKEMAGDLGDWAVMSGAPDFVLAFSDGKYATWTYRKGFLRLEDGAPLGPPSPPLESLGYNLRTLQKRNQAAIAQRRRPSSVANCESANA